MRKFVIVLALALAAVSLSHAQETGKGPPLSTTKGTVIVIDDTAPTLEDYETLLDHYKKISKKVLVPSEWKGTEMVNRKTKETVLFEKLSNYEQNVWCVGNGFKLMQEMKRFDGFWQDELKKFDDPKYTPKGKEKATGKEVPAQKKDVEKYVKGLNDIRKDFAKNYETYVEKVFKEFKDEIPEKERELHLKQIREFNDENKLIERKK